MIDAVRRAVGLVAETLALFASILFAVWAVRKLRNAIFISIVAPLVFVGPGAYPACGRRRTIS